MQHCRLFVGGELVGGSRGDVFPTLDPGTGDVLATVASASEADVDAAVDSARRAFDSGVWSTLRPADRAELMIELADMIQAHLTRLSVLEARDSGGVLARTQSDIFQGVRFMRNMANYAATRFPWTEEIPQRNAPYFSRNYIRREPVGVCAAIIPWNFPFMMAMWKISMALATGNTLILKPASDTPISALLLGEIVAQSRIPKGVVNIVTGAGQRVGEALVKDPRVDKVAFTGSTAVGTRILQLCAADIKRATMELGGKSANVVLDDADLDLAADGALFAAFLHSGQVCESGTRLLLPYSLKDSLLRLIVERTRALRVGYQLDPQTRIGPVISSRQRDAVERCIAAGLAEGAQLLCGGERVTVPDHPGGFYLAPTIFSDVDPRMAIGREEIFGPVLSVMFYHDEAEAIQLANNSPYGLAAGVWSRNLPRAERVAAQLRAGTVWINDWHVFHDHAPFGGYKHSGIGRELGHHGLLEYVETKHVHVGTESDADSKLGHRLVVKRGKATAFEFEPVTRVLSGPGSLSKLHSEMPALGAGRALVITDAGVIRAGILKRVEEILGDRIAAVFSEVPQDSGFEVIDAASNLGQRHRADVIISVGGGSVMDTAKAANVAMTLGVRAIQTVGMHHLLAPLMPHIAVPTTAGTGSEVTNVAVIRNGRLRVKSYIVDRHIIPTLAILDPLLTVDLPPLLTAATGMDALTHAIEAYTSRMANPLSDAQALHAIRLIGSHLVRAVTHGHEMNARSAMQTAATLAGWAISSANVGLVHGLSHALGARFGVPHGVGNGILLAHVIRFNSAVSQVQGRLRDVALALGADVAGKDAQTAARAAAECVDALLRASGHPTSLSSVGVPEEQLKECAAAAFVDPANLTSARRVANVEEVEALYRAAL
jgi:acyl-CoA reductase-like NAD-dependent aldehyde dehydrogenase/alcohol dehydrogenase class IV